LQIVFSVPEKSKNTLFRSDTTYPFLLTLFTDPITSWQAMTGQAYTANGTLTLTSGAFSRVGANLGQAIFYGLDAGVSGARIAGSIK
jgi:hypothetical protein